MSGNTQKADTESTTLYETEAAVGDFSNRDDRASQIVSTFVVGDSDNKAKAQGKKHLRSRVDVVLRRTHETASFTDSLVRSTPVRRLYVSSSVHCFSCTSSLSSLIRSSTLYSMCFGSSVFRAFYGATGTTTSLAAGVVPVKRIVGSVPTIRIGLATASASHVDAHCRLF